MMPSIGQKNVSRGQEINVLQARKLDSALFCATQDCLNLIVECMQFVAVTYY